MEHNDREPVIDRWLGGERFGAESRLLLGTDQLTGLALTAGRGPVPDDVLAAWRRQIARKRLALDQSEIAFVEAARARGWTWERVAEELGLPGAEVAQGRLDVLRAAVARAHPSANPRPFLP